MKVLGVTGGVGMGKSTAAKFLLESGVATLDTDLIARDIVQPGQEGLEEIKSRFGNDMIGTDGKLRRDELARRVFADAEARQVLESILHPRIREIWLRQIDLWAREGKWAAAVVIPLLFETAAEKHFNATVCIACSPTTQRERLLARGWSEEQINQRIAAQLPIEKKMALADYVIWSEGELEVHKAQLDRILRTL